VVGLDIDPDELGAAPDGAYDETLARDLCTFTGQGDADLVICQATLEHVPDTAGAIRAIASILKPGGKALIFAPSRNALFARLNLLLPQKWKENILYFVYPVPDVTQHQGFPAHYDKCTPREIEKLAQENGLEVSERHLFWMSSYFFNLVPAYVFWRLWQGIFRLVAGPNAAETFAYVLTKQPER
ncbi:MAG TPA: methyltransferase domain-containing protein, partial [Aliiroseovarius sp.]|nr:methyltransferase domain-containing protein [Aliiroseovarius sp.]